ncbi:MAG: protease inhibitor I42 family protein [Dehalococcoidia bacterium]|nr:protease inhibitor I42 family protein [Dehalococcoidia bacterium]
MNRARAAAISTCVILAVLIAVPAAYGAEEETPVAVHYEFSNTDTPVEVDVGEEFTLILKSNASTGYQWQLIEALDSSILKLVTSEYETPPETDPPMMGAPGREMWIFKSVRPGGTAISLGYSQPWMEGVPPAETETFTVVVNPVYRDASIPIRVERGQEFIISLQSNPSTDYQWQLADTLMNKEVLKVVKRQYRPPASNRIGAPGQELWTLKAVGTGKSMAILGYVRPWDRYSPPSAARFFTVIVGSEQTGQSTEYNNPDITIEVIPGREFVISLNSNASTGYQWNLTKTLDTSILELVISEYEAPTTTMLGASGREVWAFKAIAAGETTISLGYSRPWESSPPAETTVFTVTVN